MIVNDAFISYYLFYVFNLRPYFGSNLCQQYKWSRVSYTYLCNSFQAIRNTKSKYIMHVSVRRVMKYGNLETGTATAVAYSKRCVFIIHSCSHFWWRCSIVLNNIHVQWPIMFNLYRASREYLAAIEFFNSTEKINWQSGRWSEDLFTSFWDAYDRNYNLSILDDMCLAFVGLKT